MNQKTVYIQIMENLQCNTIILDFHSITEDSEGSQGFSSPSTQDIVSKPMCVSRPYKSDSVSASPRVTPALHLYNEGSLEQPSLSAINVAVIIHTTSHHLKQGKATLQLHWVLLLRDTGHSVISAMSIASISKPCVIKMGV